MLCHHKEAFALGFLSAFFILAVITLFEDVIEKWTEEFKKLLSIK